MIILASLIHLYTLILIGVVLISWFPVPQDNPVVQTLRMLTEPVLAPVRRILPDMGGIDFSPVIVLTALQFLGQFLTGG
ncbi:YggT family protein [Mariniblastus sp.]|nr:YggT family protein [Mariniblastus sp.]